MKITELDGLDQSPSPIIFGVEIDGECFTPPSGLELIGLKWKGDAPDEISDDLVDTIIAFGLSGVEVVLEVEPQDAVDHQYLLTLAGNAGFSVSATPPTDEAQLGAWIAHCEAFSAALLTTPNFAKSLFPATGYLSYLIAESFGGVDALAPSDPYTIQRFVDPTPTAWSDACKSRMRASMEITLGGPEKLTEFLGALVSGLYEEAEKFILEASGTEAGQ